MMSEMTQLYQTIIIVGDRQKKLKAIADAIKFGPEHIHTEFTDLIKEQNWQTELLEAIGNETSKYGMRIEVKTAKAATWFRMNYSE